MPILGFLIGKSRLAEVVGACRAFKTMLPNPNFDLTFGVRLADCDPARLDQIHYEWASCCDHRLFLVVGPGDLIAIDRLGPLANMFYLVLMESMESATYELSNSVERVFPHTGKFSLGEFVVADPQQFGSNEGKPAIVLDCLDHAGRFDIGKAGPFMSAATVE